MGKNLARMEMRVFLEEFTKRLPHMEIVPDQTFTFLPNTSFRGPDHLYVRWDPTQNPELRDRSILKGHAAFEIGAPVKHGLARQVRVAEVLPEADGVIRLTLEEPRGRALPGWTPGAHIEVMIGDYARKYSLCGERDDPSRLKIAILKEEAGRGGSRHIHQTITPGALIRMRGPKNHFRLDEGSERYLLVAGGIGITPIVAMADRLKQLGKDYKIHYAGRSLSSMAFVGRLQQEHGDHLHLYPKSEGRRLDLQAVTSAAPADAQIYACGPDRLLDALGQIVTERPDRLHVEHFTAVGTHLIPENEKAFEVELKDSQLSVQVPADKTLLETLRGVGVDVPSDCEEGLCGTCEVNVVAGAIDHRDKVLSAAERAEGCRMMSCCSRSRGSKLILAL